MENTNFRNWNITILDNAKAYLNKIRPRATNGDKPKNNIVTAIQTIDSLDNYYRSFWTSVNEINLEEWNK